VRVNAICPSRFVDDASTAAVVKKVQTLLTGDATGMVVTHTRS
jgi:hypothetical protein